MAIAKVILNGETLMDVTSNTNTTNNMLNGVVGTKNDGTSITGNIATKTSSNLTVSGATVTAPAGYYSTAASKAVTTTTHPNPTATIASSTGVVTASHTQTAGYVTAGTTTGTLNLTTQAATTYNTSTADQTIASYRWLTGTQTIKSVTTTNLTAANIASGVTVKVGDANNASRITQVTGTYAPATSSLTVTPTETAQTFNATGVYGYKPVTINAISSTYVGTGVAKKSSADITFASTTGTFTAPIGYYNAAATKTLTTQAAQTITPTTTAQYISSYRWLTGSQTIAAIPSTYVGSGVPMISSLSNISVSIEYSSNTAKFYANTYSIGPGYLSSSIKPVAPYHTINLFSQTSIMPSSESTIIYGPKYLSDAVTIEAMKLASLTVTPTAEQQIFNDGEVLWSRNYERIPTTTTASTDTSWAIVGKEYRLSGEVYTSGGQFEGNIDTTFTWSSGQTDIYISVIGATITFKTNTIQADQLKYWDISISEVVDGFKPVIVNAIPSAYLIPSGTSNITSNGTYDIGSYASVSVSVQGGEGVSIDDIATRNISGAISGSATSIGDTAFYHCSNLTSANFPSCTSIGSSAFGYCTSLTTVSFPVCTVINTGAFQSCTNLTTVSFPVCTSIGGNAFQSCSNLTTVSFPVCTSIGVTAFYNCTNLTSANFPSCTSIGINAFYVCRHLTTVSFPVCTFIGANAFQSCTNLTSANFPSCTSIGASAFCYCTNLTTVSFPACTSVGSRAFQSCYSLSSIFLPICQIISTSAFAYCSSLTVISLPECTVIGSYAFASCIQLSCLYLLGSTQASLMNSNAFSNTELAYSGGSIFVPGSLYDSYINANNWSYYSGSIVSV